MKKYSNKSGINNQGRMEVVMMSGDVSRGELQADIEQARKTGKMSDRLRDAARKTGATGDQLAAASQAEFERTGKRPAGHVGAMTAVRPARR